MPERDDRIEAGGARGGVEAEEDADAEGDAEGARNQLFASLRRWPNDPLALYALSLAERRLGDRASAERNLARAQAGWAGDVTQVPLTPI